MKRIIVLFLLTLSLRAYNQSEIIDSIQKIRIKNIPKLAQSFCTEDYWEASSKSGKDIFKQLCDWPDGVELRIYDEQKKEDKDVLKIDLIFQDTIFDKFYIFLVKKSDKWLIDGINDTKDLISLFFDGIYSGHFSPFDLPIDIDLINFGKKIVSFGRDYDATLDFLEQNAAQGSKTDFISQMTTNLDFEQHFVNNAGYDKRFNKGYIHFMGKSLKYENYFSEITIFVSKTQNGKIKILSRIYGSPNAEYFLLDD